ncbi:MAG: phosphopantetheine-binding protein [candidate division Zixibacteria bacterium]|nr:phosphopantetheine-binding protein [candidate division Zixibacteria bacterium]
MNRLDVENTVLSILRETSLIGNRSVNPAAPLGEQGLGLDSLALVKFITALENGFSIDLPESVWMERERLTLHQLTETIHRMAGSIGEMAPPHEPIATPAAIASEPKAVGNLFRKTIQAFRLMAKLIYKHDMLYVLSFDLENQIVPNHEASPDLRCRLATVDDLTAAKDMWPRNQRQRKLQTFLTRHSAGYSCYVAEVGGAIAAIDWVTGAEDYERNLDITIRPQPGSCYGLDLYEHPAYEEKGIGMAALIHCLGKSKEQGYRRHYTIVQTSNRKMLLTCIQLIGFTTVGQIRTRSILGCPTSAWVVNGTAGHGQVLEL